MPCDIRVPISAFRVSVVGQVERTGHIASFTLVTGCGRQDRAHSYLVFTVPSQVIVSTAYWDSYLPQIIEAVVFQGDSGTAADVHRRFQEAYPQWGANTPLVHYSPGNGFSEAR